MWNGDVDDLRKMLLSSRVHDHFYALDAMTLTTPRDSSHKRIKSTSWISISSTPSIVQGLSLDTPVYLSRELKTWFCPPSTRSTSTEGSVKQKCSCLLQRKTVIYWTLPEYSVQQSTFPVHNHLVDSSHLSSVIICSMHSSTRSTPYEFIYILRV